LASAGRRVDGGDFVDLVKYAHGELGAELHSLVDAGVADVAFDQRDEHHRERGAEKRGPPRPNGWPSAILDLQT
jgi:hypothetical protein